MSELLSLVDSPADLKRFTDEQLRQLAQEMRDELVRVLSLRPAHFASNLGVVELCLALHLCFDFQHDRLIWDTGHQIYPHKLVTGRFKQFDSIRTRGGLMGYPNPHESPFDLFMTGHAGCSVSTMLGIKSGDDLLGKGDRHAVAVVGDGALVSGIVFEALNNAGYLNKKLLVILNDNKMSICPRVGALGTYLDQCRMSSFYTRSKKLLTEMLTQIPIVGEWAHSGLEGIRDSLKAVLKDGMLFEELGFRYYGPVNGHDLAQLRRTLEDVKQIDGPVLLHVLTEKGHGVPEASQDPVTFHTPPVFDKIGPDRTILALRKGSSKAYTDAVSSTIAQVMTDDERVTVMTAGMCQGNKLEKVRELFPQRFFDVGICESHAVAFAAGQAKAGLRPIVNIYSTFLQRSFDQIFQEVALQNLPVTFTLDRSGLTGPDGPTHHGCFDIAYMRLFPNLAVMAPGDEQDVAPMLKFALMQNGPVSMRYPKANLEKVERPLTAIELGRSEVYEWGDEVMLIAFGSVFPTCVKAAQKLKEEGISAGVINARFVKPLDRETICRSIEQSTLVITVEEGTLEGGFGSAVLEVANAAGLDTRMVVRLGVPDRFIEHAERSELLAELGLDANGICKVVRQRIEVPREELNSILSLPVLREG
jgi:1-deoxy-D-xylulose-5-phosphate synthase